MRMYTGCGGVFRTSDVPQQDGLANGTFVAANGSYSGNLAWAAHSAQRTAIAVLPNRAPNNYYGSTPGEVQLYADDRLILQGRLLLTAINDGSPAHQVYGRSAFWNKANGTILVISQVFPSAGLLADLVRETATPAAIQGCAVTLGSDSANVASSGGPVN
jgi:hypothetical protein